METNWITDVIMPLSSAFIGGLLALIGVGITLNHEKKERKKEQLDKAKPIIINYMLHAVDKNQPIPKYIFSNQKTEGGKNITGIFKNTDNGILFFDYIETETKIYHPKHSSAVDKNTVFYVIIDIVSGETLKKCIFHCHDIFGTKYCYEASFCFESGRQSELMVGNIQTE
jgi:hypothetical protein